MSASYRGYRPQPHNSGQPRLAEVYRWKTGRYPTADELAAFRAKRSQDDYRSRAYWREYRKEHGIL